MLRFHKMKQAELELTEWQAEPLSALLPEGAEYYHKALQNGDTLFVLYDEKKPVGLLGMAAETVGEKPACAVVTNIVLLPEYRRHGLGKMLMGLAAGEAVERRIWFLAGSVPHTAEAEGFASAIHFRQTEWLPDMAVLDLSDVEGLRHG